MNTAGKRSSSSGTTEFYVRIADFDEAEVQNFNLDWIQFEPLTALPAWDFGDAPDSFGTSLSDDGPRHEVAPDAAVHLGATVTTEADALSSDDDDADDALFAPIAYDSSAPTQLQVPVTNTSASSALFNVWYGLNASGTFEPAELIRSAIVPPATMSEVVTLQLPAGLVEGTYWLRMRIAGAADALAPTGAAGAGEVEDWPVAVQDPPTVDSPPPASGSSTGDSPETNRDADTQGSLAATGSEPPLELLGVAIALLLLGGAATVFTIMRRRPNS